MDRVVRISVIVSGLSEMTERLQPWRYLMELAKGLDRRGHVVELISERPTTLGDWSRGPIRVGIGTFHPSDGLAAHLRRSRPEVVLWNTGTTSALRLRHRKVLDSCHVAVFTSPLYRPWEMLRARLDLVRHPMTYGVLGLGSLLPRPVVARYLAEQFSHVVAPGVTTARHLVASGLEPSRVTALPPGRDDDIDDMPVEAGHGSDGTTFLYAGSPLPIRGADILIRAFARAFGEAGGARLLILSRHERPGLVVYTEQLVSLAKRLRVHACVEVVPGMLSRTEFLEQIARADAFALPFRLVPSEAPLSVLESAGAGRVLVSSELPAVANLAAPGSLLTKPGDVAGLSTALRSLAADPTATRRLGLEARAWYVKWPTWNERVERLDRLLASIVGLGPSIERDLHTDGFSDDAG